ncbi:MAG: flagellar hook assembly protein FlgD [Alphaproteobacteria bacterium]|nr:flagellar hook assembly protein FlgD [Alphaproteobacteria bacterium]MDE2109973.1 flagellar hook assembly protein FlgD [Alphaproteobacteria bacterium]MDE2494428.1 flagellar hook assembly protein FlgD [Alphaproteobacteria bacterium]
MTATSPVTTPTASTTTTSSSSSSAQQQLAGNFNTFLQLLTTQLQNQDPLSPMDSNQFTQQLVEYSQVEQQINSNSKLDTLISLGQNQANSYAMSYLGKNVVLSNGQGALTNGAADWTYGLNGAAASTTLTVTDSSGKVVYSGAGQTAAGTHDFAWNGKDNNGNQLPDGSYTLTASATASDGTPVTTTVASKALVSGVDLSGTTPQLVIGTAEIPLANATIVTN